MPLETIDRLDRAVARLEQVVYGAEDVGLPGIKTEQYLLRADVDRLLARKPKPGLWAGGYFAFMLAFLLTIKEVRGYFDISPQLALLLIAVFTGLAFVMFYGGFGWFEREASK